MTEDILISPKYFREMQYERTDKVREVVWMEYTNKVRH